MATPLGTDSARTQPDPFAALDTLLADQTARNAPGTTAPASATPATQAASTTPPAAAATTGGTADPFAALDALDVQPQPTVATTPTAAAGPSPAAVMQPAATQPTAEPAAEEDDPGFLETVGDVAQGLGTGVVQSVTDTAEGVVNLGEAVATPLLNAFSPGAADAVESLADDARNTVADVEDAITGAIGPVDTQAGRIAAIGGNLAGSVAQFAIPGAAIGKIGRVGNWLSKAGRAKRLMFHVGIDAPVTAALAASSPEASSVGFIAEHLPDGALKDRMRGIADDPIQRAAAEVAVDAVLFGAGSEVVRLARGGDAARGATSALDEGQEVARRIQDPTDVTREANLPEQEINPAAVHDIAEQVEIGMGNPEIQAAMDAAELELPALRADLDGTHRLQREADKIRFEAGGGAAGEALAPATPLPWPEQKKAIESAFTDLGLRSKKFNAGARNLPAAEVQAVPRIVQRNTAKAAELTQRLTDPTVSGDARQAANDQLSALWEQTDNVLGRVAQKAEGAMGRDRDRLRLLAGATDDPRVWEVEAERILNQATPEDAPRVSLNDRQRTRLRRELRKGNTDKTVRFVQSLPASRGEKLTTLVKASLLSGIDTQTANAIGTTTMTGLETVKDPAAFLGDRLIGIFTGHKTRGLPSPLSSASANVRGAARGFGDVKKAIAEGGLDTAAAKWDYDHTLVLNNAFFDSTLGAGARGIFGLMDRTDRMFFNGAFERSLVEQADAMARAEGISGRAARNARARELVSAPTDEMRALAEYDGRTAVFRDRADPNGAHASLQQRASLSRLGDAMVRFKKELGDGALGTLAELAVPFVNTPSRIAARVIEYSPAGGIMALTDAVRLGLKGVNASPQLQRQVAAELGRAATGSAVAFAPVFGGFALAKAGAMTGAYPSDQSERNLWRLTGKQEYSVKLGDNWYSVDRVAPGGSLLALGADLYNAWSDPEASATRRAAMAAATPLRVAANNLFLENTGRLLAATSGVLSGEERFEEQLAEQAGRMVVPSIVKDIARVGDDVQREAEGFTETIQAGIPGLRQQLPEKLDPLGRPIPAAGDIVSTTVLPARTSPDRSNRIIERANELGLNFGTISQRAGESADIFERRQRAAGQRVMQALQDVMLSDEFAQATTDAERLKMLERAKSGARRDVTKEFKEMGLLPE